MSRAYFKTLNYTLANEDTALELAILPDGVDHVLSVAGSGGRVMPLLARSPRHVTCVDLVPEQLWLTELRFESLRAFDLEDFKSFWGYPPSPADPEKRRRLFERIRLSPEAHAFLWGLFEAKAWNSILYDGKWEDTFAKISRLTRFFTGEAGAKLFECRTLEEQRRYLASEFPWMGWRALIFLFGNARLFNTLLYKGHFPRKNIPKSFYAFYFDAFRALFERGLARENYFLEVLFFGRVVHPEACPIECDPEVYARAKRGLEGANIEYRAGDLIELTAQASRPVDFLSLSDVPSYFSGELERNFLQRCARRLAPNAIVVLRNYMHVPEGLDRTGFRTITAEHSAAIAREKLQMYDVEIFRRA